MACNRAVENVLTRRLRSPDVRESPRLAAGAVLIAEHLEMVQAISRQSDPPPPDLPALERAIRRSPDDLLLARSYATRCRAPQCDEQAAFARLVALEPHNLATWMLAPHDQRRPTRAEDDAWLAQAAHAAYFDPHYSEVAFAVLEAAGPIPPLPVCDGPLRAMAPDLERQPQPADAIIPMAHVIASQQLPAHLRLWRACVGSEEPGRRQADCQKVHALLAGSNEVIYAGGSLRWLAAHAQPQSERARWSARWRELQWAMQAGGGRALSFGNLPLVLEQGEIPVLMGYLEEHSQWPPPRDWQPPAIP